MYKNIIMIILVAFLGANLFGCDNSDIKYYEDYDEVTSSQNYYQDGELGLEISSQMDAKQKLVPVYVCGAVSEPGVYYLAETALKEEALALAGGYDLGAAEGYVNLAETVVSGEKIYFPYEDELAQGDGVNPNSGKVNINTATQEELMTLPGIGASKAQAIIKYREEYGPFQSIEDITNISGIKEGVYNNIKEYIIVD